MLEKTLLRVPWTTKRSNQSILKEINPELSLEGLMLKLMLQYFGCLMRRADSLEKTLMLGKIEGKRRSGQQKMRWLDSITFPARAHLQLEARTGCQWAFQNVETQSHILGRKESRCFFIEI